MEANWKGGKYKRVREWGLKPYSTLTNICPTRLRLDCGAVRATLSFHDWELQFVTIHRKQESDKKINGCTEEEARSATQSHLKPGKY